MRGDLGEHLVDRRLRVRWTGSDRLDLLWRCAGADVRESAEVLAAQAGQLHHRLLPRRMQ